MKKALYFDVETTGLNPSKHDIIQFACLVEINGEVVEEWETKIRPFDFGAIEDKALEVNGLTRKQLEDYPHPKEVYNIMVKMFDRYIGKFDKTDKFAPAGFNVKFDMDFLSNFFKKNNDKYYGSYFNYRAIDPLYKLYELDYERKLNLPDYKLATACAHFGIDIQAHDALSDIKATRALRIALSEMYNVIV